MKTVSKGWLTVVFRIESKLYYLYLYIYIYTPCTYRNKNFGIIHHSFHVKTNWEELFDVNYFVIVERRGFVASLASLVTFSADQIARCWFRQRLLICWQPCLPVEWSADAWGHFTSVCCDTFPREIFIKMDHADFEKCQVLFSYDSTETADSEIAGVILPIFEELVKFGWIFCQRVNIALCIIIYMVIIFERISLIKRLADWLSTFLKTKYWLKTRWREFANSVCFSHCVCGFAINRKPVSFGAATVNSWMK